MTALNRVLDTNLAPSLRVFAAVVGTVLIGIALLWVYSPPHYTSTTADAQRFVHQTVSAPAELTSIIVVLLIAGTSFLLFALNGHRFTKFSAAGVSAESENAADLALRYFKQDDDSMPPPRDINIGEREIPQATQGSTGSVEFKDDVYSVYGIAEVPLQVMADVITNWPEDIPKPASLTEFEFAARKKGKGNHSWELKFRGKPFVFVSYGGYGKPGATVYGPPSM